MSIELCMFALALASPSGCVAVAVAGCASASLWAGGGKEALASSRGKELGDTKTRTMSDEGSRALQCAPPCQRAQACANVCCRACKRARTNARTHARTHAGRQAGRQAGMQAGRQVGRQTGWQVGR